MTESELEQIIKASAYSERLVIRFSNVRCSSSLDFHTTDKYKTKFLSFYNWGNDSKNSDWKAHPDMFENIVEAISKCGLKDSLETFDIQGCQLDKKTIQEMFNKHKMSNISVVDDQGYSSLIK